MTQEAFHTSPAVRDACAASIFGHSETLVADLGAALAESEIDAGDSVASLAWYTQTVIQGAFVLSRAANDQAVVIEAIDHLRRYLECVFGRASTEATT